MCLPKNDSGPLSCTSQMENPEVIRTAYQRLYDMILSYGVDVRETGREKEVHYRFFDDPDNDGKDAVYGLNGPLNHLVNALKSAAAGYGIERRVLLLHGPVGSSKSTIARLLKKGMERYTSTDEGALYTLGGVVYGFKFPDPSPRWFGFHEVFHSFTVLAFAAHYVGVSLATYSLR